MDRTMNSRFKTAVRRCGIVFRNPENHRAVERLPAIFWAALWLLEFDCCRSFYKKRDFKLTAKYYEMAEKHLGSPEDFGDGTPCADALCEVYAAWTDMAAAEDR